MAMKVALLVAVALCVIAPVLADVYGHGIIRFSNNRLNEQSANRDNGDRLFDSQNNNRGGYNVGERTKAAFPQNIATADAGPDATYLYTDTTTAAQYQQLFYEGSITQLEWTAQHACGGNEQDDPQKINCNIVLQYMCNTDNAVVTDPAMQVILRDGLNTQTPDAPTTIDNIPANNAVRGHHESEASYYECTRRSRNYGLFHADQQLNGQSAIYTRQNNNGNRRGLECTEERDYYPYWTPNPWRDIAYLTDDVTRCPLIQAGTQNTNTVYKCTAPTVAGRTDTVLKPITEAACTDSKVGGVWTAYSKNIAAPDCIQVDWSRDNHLGNGRYGQPLSYNWTMPLLSSLGSSVARYGSQSMAKCVLRLRYNISTDDYNPWAINSTYDDNPSRGIVSPVQQNPTVDVGADLQGLKLAINTAQFGRTFQDRTHVFYIAPKPAVTGSNKIINLSVRGKRGNIVQTYPAVEYDFLPNRLHLTTNDFLHIQWTGSNTHNNGNPGGDGQTGDAGEGTGGTDRQNFVQMLNKDDNYPIPLDKITDNIFTRSDCYAYGQSTALGSTNCAITLATSGQYRDVAGISQGTFDPLLNDAPASLIGGVLMKINTAGEYNYMCTRNNNFSNRSQKGVLIVA